MRCLTLADELRKRGTTVHFLCRHLPDHLRELLVQKQYNQISLTGGNGSEPASSGLAHSNWLGVSQEDDAIDTVRALESHGCDWLVVDHYALDSTWESRIRQIGCRILAIDDLADRSHDCDVLLDQNFYADAESRYVAKVPQHCRLLLGPRYALLRDEFRKLREISRSRDGTIRRVLVFFGGFDSSDYTGRAVQTLAELATPDLQVDVIIGAKHPARTNIELLCAHNGFICYVQTEKMAELMAAADLAIGAGGVATWERCCLGLPTLAFCTAENQARQLADAASQGWINVPDANGDFASTLKLHFKGMLENGFLVRAIAQRAMQAADGRGVARVASALGITGISLRVATADDSKNLFNWRNSPAVRSASRNTAPIEWDNHQRWFESVLIAPDRILLVGERADTVIGIVRFDLQDQEAEVSIYLVPGTKQPGLGNDLLVSATNWLTTNRPDVLQVSAHVLGGNIPSERLFLGAGYKVVNTNYLKRLK